MGELYIGTIIAWPIDYAPQGWAFCNGAILPAAQNAALFSLLGNRYGGDGQTTFALPNLNGRVPVGGAMGGTMPPGVSTYNLGAVGGAESVTLTNQNLPQHTHAATTTTSGLSVSGITASIPASSTGGSTNTPGPSANLAAYEDTEAGAVDIYTTGNTDTNLKPFEVSGGTVSGNVATTISPNGSSLPADIRQPYQALNYIICVQGYYPPRP